MRAFERLFTRSPAATSVGNTALASVAGLSAERGPQRVWDAMLAGARAPLRVRARSDAVAAGNRKVFEEIGREFARFLALPVEGGAIEPSELASFREACGRAIRRTVRTTCGRRSRPTRQRSARATAKRKRS